MRESPTIPPVAIASIFSFLILVGGIALYNSTSTTDTPSTIPNQATTTPQPDVKNITYMIDGESFSLVNGVATKDTVPGSASKNTLSVFGEPVYGDLSGDGVPDAALTLINNPGGSGAFFYAVLAIKQGNTYLPTNTLLLGDRIAPQPTTITNGRATYNYAMRKANEPMTAQPSIGKSLTIHYSTATNEIGELANNFEGETNPDTMTLSMKKWTWIKTTMNDGSVTIPKRSDAFSLSFAKNNTVSIETDCNRMNGQYSVKGNTLNFGALMSTKMFCEGSQENVFSQSLTEVVSYLFTTRGELILEIKMDSGVMVFK